MVDASKKLSIVMAVYNEERTIVEALSMVVRAKLSIAKEIIIVNDGSTDKSEELILNFIKDDYPNVSFKYIKKDNGGKGSAVREGFKESTGDIVIIQDGDCENNPEDYQACIDPILAGEAQVVYGSRERYNKKRSHSSWFFYLGGLSVSLGFNLLYGSSLTDAPTCYKTFEGDLIRNLDFSQNRFGWEPEVTAKLLRLGFEIHEVPIEYHPRKVEEGKKIRLKDGIQALCLIFLYLFYPIVQERKKLEKNYSDSQGVMKAKRKFKDGLFWLFILAMIIRLILSLPSMAQPENFLRLDSAGFFIGSENFFWGARAPFYSFIIYIFSKFEGNLYLMLATFGIFVSSLGVYICGYIGKILTNSYKVGILCAILWMTNITSIGNSPLILSDTIFAFFVGLQVLFFAKLYKKERLIDFAYGCFFAVLACLVRFVNLPFVLIVAPILGLIYLKKPWKIVAGIVGNYLLILALIVPFMYANSKRNQGFTLEANGLLALTHNSSAIIAHAQKRDSNIVLAEEQAKVKEFIDKNSPTILERNQFIKERYFEVIKENPKSFVLTHMPQAFIMLPDLPSVCENLKITSSGRGTLGVIRKDGLIAGVKFYFGDRANQVILWLMPFLLLTLIGYIGCFLELCRALCKFNLKLIVLWGAVSLYYVVLPGPVIMPRYHLAALYLIFALAAKFIIELKLKKIVKN